MPNRLRSIQPALDDMDDIPDREDQANESGSAAAARGPANSFGYDVGNTDRDEDEPFDCQRIEQLNSAFLPKVQEEEKSCYTDDDDDDFDIGDDEELGHVVSSTDILNAGPSDGGSGINNDNNGNRSDQERNGYEVAILRNLNKYIIDDDESSSSFHPENINSQLLRHPFNSSIRSSVGNGAAAGTGGMISSTSSSSSSFQRSFNQLNESSLSDPGRISLRVEGVKSATGADDDDDDDDSIPKRRRNTVAVRGSEVIKGTRLNPSTVRVQTSSIRSSLRNPTGKLISSFRQSRIGQGRGMQSSNSVSNLMVNPSPISDSSQSSSHFSRRPSSVTRESSSSLHNRGDRLTISDSERTSTAAAAAAVIAASVQVPARRRIQFGKGDYALVQESRLAYPTTEAEADLCTVVPVNQFGYPPGEGKTEKEKHGPYKYVLCKIVQVHFDEDERYYTVRRCDTGTEQRADLGFDWMEPIINESAMEMALWAARQSRRSIDENIGKSTQNRSWLWEMIASPLDYIRTVILPYYRGVISSTKMFLKDFLRGDNNFFCKVGLTCINFFVICSIIFVFLDVMVLAFADASLDHTMAIVGFIVWFILALELFFECAIRPNNYFELIQSDKAYAPSTARHINSWHMILETLALILYYPQLPCAFRPEQCGIPNPFSSINISLLSVTSSSISKAAAGQFALGLAFLRAFGLVRHWKQMWINHTFDTINKEKSLVGQIFLFKKRKHRRAGFLSSIYKKKLSSSQEDDLDSTLDGSEDSNDYTEHANEEDMQLKNAATIGTALMVVNSHRFFTLLLFLVCVFPLIYSMDVRNPSATNMFNLLQENNVLSNTTTDCDYLFDSVRSWLITVTYGELGFNPSSSGEHALTVQFAQVLPVRCDWQRPTGIITSCNDTALYEIFPACKSWDSTVPDDPADATPEYFADVLNARLGAMTLFENTRIVQASFNSTDPLIDATGMQEFYVKAIFNQTRTVKSVNLSLSLLLLSMVLLVLIGLSAMRADAARLVLYPIQRMLKIVVRYAENPLYAPASKDELRNIDPSEELGHFETEQLINAISKIADLLRKCWGVAGAGIISSNLARTKAGRTVVFNPTIPGKRVYALFGFVGINEFDKQLQSLDKDVMKLINDVARVVHDEVYRWALGESGQCNKNLGGAFLMVYRIGDFTEVHDRKKRATDVIFNTHMKKGARVRSRGVRSSSRKSRNGSRHFDITSDGTLQLASLPGIQGFTDRALLGLLKSYAGLHRDHNMQKWERDFRLSAGIGKFKINVIFGMDAGWAVEGAVGSEYKIDATYLSPHVNMASRMMSACKQYGVTLLLSQAVEELLSKSAKAVMRHLDTVYVKGSNVAQRIYTYDARYAGVDFFLFERSPEQADVEADAYTPSIWERDQDLKSMRQHVSDEFHSVFKNGVEQYIEGEWESAIKTLQAADEMMLKAVLEEGYVDFDYGEIDESDLLDMNKSSFDIDRVRNAYGDGASKCLVQYMQRRDGIPPPDWHGVRKLDSK